MIAAPTLGEVASDASLEYLSFVAMFVAVGAVGFRFAVLRLLTRSAGEEQAVFARASRVAAGIGAAGAAVLLALAVQGLLHTMAAKQLTFGATMAANHGAAGLRLGFAGLALVGFLLTLATPAAWPVAGIGVVAFMLRGLVALQLARMVNPVHELAASSWIGTLFVLMMAGVPSVLRSRLAREEKARLVARMVNAFSPLALVAAGVLVLSGVTTALRHITYLEALWTTPYGETFLVKLSLVTLVVLLGAWNWRRVRPTLGRDADAATLRRTAASELTAAALVLVATAVLVSLPVPRRPGAQAANAGAGVPTAGATAVPGAAAGATGPAAPAR